ncbi:hypothetical protein H5410_007128, partial [Solanum commersonii]
MQQQQPSSKMAHQGLITRAAGIWYYKCRICLELFTSSQGLAGHQRKHMSQETWIRGMPHYKLFCPSTNLPTLYDKLGSRQSTPTVGPQRFPGCPQSIHDQSYQATVPHADLFVHHLNQQIPYGNHLNVNLLLAYTPIESISLPIESSSNVT